LADEVASKVRFEVTQIDRLFETYADLLAGVQRSTPNHVEIAALSTVLHSFYGGLENIFQLVAKRLDASLPRGPTWHRDLLAQMAEQRPHRVPVISAPTARHLAEYLGFRHVFRHAYTFYLDWNELRKLVLPLDGVWAQTKQELLAFLESLEPNAA
jgi:hypothetical protein